MTEAALKMLFTNITFSFLVIPNLITGPYETGYSLLKHYQITENKSYNLK